MYSKVLMLVYVNIVLLIVCWELWKRSDVCGGACDGTSCMAGVCSCRGASK